MRELLVTVEESLAEPLCDALLEAGALTVSVEDADADTDAEQALYGEPGTEPEQLGWRNNRLVALIDGDIDPQQLLQAAADALGIPLPQLIAVRDVADADWVTLTQAQFPPTQVGPRLWIVPSWHEPPPDPQAIVIRLDPGAAFGTGTHPTTQLCLGWLDAHVQPGMRVLDYGCGSGILAIAAAKLGAADVSGCDIDPQAVETARANHAANLDDLAQAGASAAAIGRYTLPDALPADARYDLVLANILSMPLKLLAPALLARVAPGGALVLSGILARQAQELIDTYAEAREGMQLQVWRELDGWVCLAGRRA